MRFWATGITVVTAEFESVQHGMTVSSFTSVSLEPPQVLISLQQNTRTHYLISRSRAFGVNILGEDQREISNRFAGRIPDEENRFDQLEPFTINSRIPFIPGGLAYLECKVVTTLGSGTHTIFIGEVTGVRDVDGDHQPLIYFNREYYSLSTK